MVINIANYLKNVFEKADDGASQCFYCIFKEYLLENYTSSNICQKISYKYYYLLFCQSYSNL